MTVPFMPLYVADYMADTAHLTTIEHGAYLLLIMTYWQRGEKLPDDDRKLARIVGLDPRQWKRIRDNLAEFFDIADGWWLHRRLETELQHLRDKSLKKRKGGLARAKQMESERSARGQLYIDTDTDTDTEQSIPLAKANGGDGDSDKLFWANAKDYLRPYIKSDPGALVNKWLREHNRELTGQAIAAAQMERAADPVAYIQGFFRKRENREWSGGGVGPNGEIGI